MGSLPTELMTAVGPRWSVPEAGLAFRQRGVRFTAIRRRHGLRAERHVGGDRRRAGVIVAADRAAAIARVVILLQLVDIGLVGRASNVSTLSSSLPYFGALLINRWRSCSWSGRRKSSASAFAPAGR